MDKLIHKIGLIVFVILNATCMTFMQQINAARGKAVFFSIICSVIGTFIITGFIIAIKHLFNREFLEKSIARIVECHKKIDKHVYIYLLLSIIIIFLLINLLMNNFSTTAKNRDNISAANTEEMLRTLSVYDDFNLQNNIIKYPARPINSNAVYPIYSQEKLDFIDDNGQKIFSIKKELDFHYIISRYNNGAALIVVDTDAIPSTGKFLNEKNLKAYIIDILGNTTELEFKPRFYWSLVNGTACLPIFRDGKIVLQDENEDYYLIDITGKILKKQQEEIKLPVVNKYYEEMDYIDGSNYKINENYPHPIDDNGNAKYLSNEGVVTIDVASVFPGGSDDLTRDPYFYNGVAMVFFRKPGGLLRRFVDTQGRFINEDIYEYAEPFYNNLTWVCTKKKCGYINTNGKWVAKSN